MNKILIDYRNMAYRNYFKGKNDIASIGYSYFKYLIIKEIFDYIKNFRADEIIIVNDSTLNWRKKIYPDYKGQRSKNREKQEDVDWETVFKEFDSLFSEIKQLFPFVALNINYCEADDIIAVLTKYEQQSKKVIVSTDGDYIQLLKYNNVKIYDPKNSTIVKCDDPEKELKIKIYSGDGGDNIPNILKQFVGDNSIKKRFGKETAKEYIDGTKSFKQLLEDNTPVMEDGKQVLVEGQQLTVGLQAKLGLKRNTILIDHNYIPSKLQEIIKKEYDNYVTPEGSSIYNYVTHYNMRDLIDNMQIYEPYIKALLDYQESKKVF
jgi:5'-3' exonuclease